ncbi:cbb3-type cytochrome oxidase assembly protein CcoS [Pseudomonas sp.]|uniref:cbb3-type cytochrome oxidase assembly protein CcoS n=1 Tax=Pseudomonas sp. TaxID=306 RepID=UPI003BB6A4C3
MPAIYILIPVAIALVGFAIWLFFWAVDSGQYDDLDGPAHSILFDDEDPKHQAAVSQVQQQDRSTESGDKPGA